MRDWASALRRGGAHTHTFAKSANVWGTRPPNLGMQFVCRSHHWEIVVKKRAAL